MLCLLHVTIATMGYVIYFTVPPFLIKSCCCSCKLIIGKDVWNSIFSQVTKEYKKCLQASTESETKVSNNELKTIFLGLNGKFNIFPYHLLPILHIVRS